jgi:hypothetical protein
MRVSTPKLDQNNMNPSLGAISTDVEAGTTTNDDGHTKKDDHSSGTTRRRKQLWYIIGGVSVLVLAAVVVVAVLVFASQDDFTPQQQQLSEIAKSISNKQDLQNPASPQNMAYNWLIHQDTFYSDADAIPRELVVQRYVLAVFYYATMGHPNWVPTSKWLQGHECLGDWLGVSCNDQGFVSTLEFGKSTNISQPFG